jgi:hypothetical protein
MGGEADACRLEEWADTVSGSDGEAPDTPPDANTQADLAMATLFATAVSLILTDLRTVRRSDLDSFIAALRAQRQAKQAEAYERQAALAANTPYIVTRQRTDARIEAFVKGMGNLTRTMFNSNLYGVLATLTNVAFEDAGYDQQRIRALLRQQPGSRRFP